ncbi:MULTISPECIES: hypothetical protein [unclassified Nocardia]|uniref:hypothetical protein n=1 Tax=unclassified Nocardia TaxID=2637762 RepID=UPI001CE4A20E|nr:MULTISPECIES: hypothetical protein [unclassified Nocardia]
MTRRPTLYDRQVEEIIDLHVRQRRSPAEIAAAFDIDPSSVSQILHGKTYQHITGGKILTLPRAETSYRRAVAEYRLATEPGLTRARIARDLGITRQAVGKLLTDCATPPGYAVAQHSTPRNVALWPDARWYSLTPTTGWGTDTVIGHIILTTPGRDHSTGESPTETHIFGCDAEGRLTNWNELFGSPFPVDGDHAAALRQIGYLRVDQLPPTTTPPTIQHPGGETT